ncbi:MAG TPA: Ig-like domain-containing protein [Nocardioides sp.]|nr:Ig-like domain-containing protein [Nocardioides sp.]
MVRALVGAMAMVSMSMGAAQATTGAPPVTVDDAVTVTALRGAAPDVLANDSDPDGDPLAVCRLGTVPSGLDAEIIDGKLELFPFTPGTYSLTYYACDFDYLTPGTVTVTVKPAPKIAIRVLKSDSRPGQLKVVNRGSFTFAFQWGSYKKVQPDGRVHVAAHSSRWVHVRRVSVTWVASNARRGAFRIGFVRGIKLPRGVHALPPGAPAAGGSFTYGTTSSFRWAVSGR